MGLHACSRMRSSNINEPGTDTIRARIRRSELVIFSNKLTIIKIIIILLLVSYFSFWSVKTIVYGPRTCTVISIVIHRVGILPICDIESNS